MNETFEDLFGEISDAVKTVEVEERGSEALLKRLLSVCISLSQFWAVGLQLSEVPFLLSAPAMRREAVFWQRSKIWWCTVRREAVR